MDDDYDRTASIMTPARLAQVKSAAAAPVSPAVFLDRMAADVGHAHIARLSELRTTLAAQDAASRLAAMLAALQRLDAGLQALDFNLLEQQKGWLAGLTGKAKAAGAEFAAQVERADAAAQALLQDLRADEKPAQARATDRTLVEFEVECRALEKIIDQGARWLQDMRRQLEARRAQAASDPQVQQQVRDDEARCAVLAPRLDAIRAAAAAAQQASQQARSAAERHAALDQALQQPVARALRAWRETVPPLGPAAAEGRGGKLDLQEAKQAHAKLRDRVARVLADGQQLQSIQAALAQALERMAGPLAAAA